MRLVSRAVEGTGPLKPGNRRRDLVIADSEGANSCPNRGEIREMLDGAAVAFVQRRFLYPAPHGADADGSAGGRGQRIGNGGSPTRTNPVGYDR